MSYLRYDYVIIAIAPQECTSELTHILCQIYVAQALSFHETSQAINQKYIKLNDFCWGLPLLSGMEDKFQSKNGLQAIMLTEQKRVNKFGLFSAFSIGLCFSLPFTHKFSRLPYVSLC